MKYMRRMVSCFVIVLAGLVIASDASSQIRIELGTPRRTRPHFMVYPHHRSWYDGRYYRDQRRRDYQMDRRRAYEEQRRHDMRRNQEHRGRGRR